MRSKPNSLHDPANRTGTHELDGARHGCDLEALRIVHRPDASCLGDDATQLGELRGAGAAGLVHHHVLAMLHRRDGDRRAVGWDCRRNNQRDVWVLQ
jgi:hypothetical protein